MNDFEAQLKSVEPMIKRLSRSGDYDLRDLGYQIERAFYTVWFANRHLEAGACENEASAFKTIVTDEEFWATTRRLEEMPVNGPSEAEIISALSMRRRLSRLYHSVKPLAEKPRDVPFAFDDPFDEAVAFTKGLEMSADLNARDFGEECDSCFHGIWLAKKAPVDPNNPIEQDKYRAIIDHSVFWGQFKEMRAKLESGGVSDEDIIDMHLTRRRLWKELLGVSGCNRR